MDLLRSARHLADATETEPIDWAAVAEAAKAATPSGSLSLSAEKQRGYREDVISAREAVRATTPLRFDLPDRLEIHDRHHWIDANVDTFRRLFAPLAEQQRAQIAGPVRTLNNASMALTLGLLSRYVLGQYDPILLADTDDHAMYFVHPNIHRIAGELDLDVDRFRRWIAFHEVTHAAEFGAAPWLRPHIESHVTRLVEALAAGNLDRGALEDVNATMTAVEGYAELVMDEAFDEDPTELREKLDARRRRLGPLRFVLDRLLGLQIKRRQYEQGKAFFETVVDERGMAGASAVWTDPSALPTLDEFENPHRWIARVNP